MAQLILYLKERELGRYPLLSSALRIGRDPTNELVIDNDDVGGLFRDPSDVASVGNRLLVVNARLLTDPGPDVDYDVVRVSR